jgi:hypothetical protein
MNPKASCGVLYLPLRGIVQLANSDALCFQNWSFTIKTGTDHQIQSPMIRAV